MPLRILGIETSGEPLSIALLAEEELLGLSVLGLPRAHDRMAAEFIRRLLEDCELELQHIDAVALSAGPGSFTGLRIGASLAKGLCFGSPPPTLVAVPTLEAIAEAAAPVAQACKAEQILACVVGHLTRSDTGVEGWLFVQSFSPTAVPLSGVERCDLTALHPTPATLVCGPAAPLLPSGIHIPWLERLSAEWIARAGLRRYRRGESTPAEEFVPFYGMEFAPSHAHPTDVADATAATPAPERSQSTTSAAQPTSGTSQTPVQR